MIKRTPAHCRSRAPQARGFTLIELLVVMAILAILMERYPLVRIGPREGGDKAAA